MRMICYIKRCTLESDPRMQKYVKACRDSQIEYFLLTWDRLCDTKTFDTNEYCFKKYAPFGNGLKNILGLIGWVIFVEFHLLIKLKKYRVIHASNFDSYILAYPFKIFGKKIIFDVYDSSSFKSERKKAANADLLILPHERRLEKMQLSPSEVKNLLIVENTPIFPEYADRKPLDKLPEKIRLSYVGSFEQNVRGLENLLNVVRNDDRFVLNIAGSGGGLESMVRDYDAKSERITYFGKVPYLKAIEIMRESDFIVAMYYLIAKAHKWACPNKICESLYLNVPVITSKGTLVGNDVESDNTGYVVEDNAESFSSLFDDYGSRRFLDAYNMKVRNCSMKWKNKYEHYYENNLLRGYISTVRSLIKC